MVEKQVQFTIDSNNQAEMMKYHDMEHTLKVMCNLMNSIDPAAAPLVHAECEKTAKTDGKTINFWWYEFTFLVKGAQKQVDIIKEYLEGMLAW